MSRSYVRQEAVIRLVFSLITAFVPYRKRVLYDALEIHYVSHLSGHVACSRHAHRR